jgi:hypothetical protein
MRITRYYVITPNAALGAHIAASGGAWEALVGPTVWSNIEGGRTAITEAEHGDAVKALFVVHVRRDAVEASVASALGLHDEVPLSDLFARWWTLEAFEEDDATDSVAASLARRADVTADERALLTWFPERPR